MITDMRFFRFKPFRWGPAGRAGWTTATLRELGARTLFPWLTDAAIDWLVIGGALADDPAYVPHFYTVLAGILIIGNRQHALAILGHDGTHYTLSRNAALNDFLTNLFCFWPLGLTVSGYRALHYAHHKNTGTENDPELGHKRMRVLHNGIFLGRTPWPPFCATR